MKLEAVNYVILVVEDLERSIRFYTEVMGLELKHRGGPAYAEFATEGPTRLSLYTREAMSRTLGTPLRPAPGDAPGFEIGFFVPDVDTAYRELVDLGATALTPPADQPWGQRTAYVRDPDGHLIELVTPLSERTH